LHPAVHRSSLVRQEKQDKTRQISAKKVIYLRSVSYTWYYIFPVAMNTQNILFNNADKIPEGVYLQLMNALKLDFEQPPVIKTPQRQLIGNAFDGFLNGSSNIYKSGDEWDQCISYLNDICDDQEIIKSVFDDYFLDCDMKYDITTRKAIRVEQENE
jgi:hypothetical protein